MSGNNLTSKEKLPDWLRRWYCLKGEPRFREAADEIERLQGELDAAEQHVKILRENAASHEPPGDAAVRVALRHADHATGESMDALALKRLAEALRASQPPLDARYCPFNHKPCEPIDLGEETSETKEAPRNDRAVLHACNCGHSWREHQTPGTECAVEDCPCGYYREIERLEFAPPADPGPVQTFEPNGPERGFATMCANCGQTFGKHIAQDHHGNSSVCPVHETSASRCQYCLAPAIAGGCGWPTCPHKSTAPSERTTHE